MDLTLDQLLNSLTSGMDKQAEEKCEDKEDKKEDEKAEGKKEEKGEDKKDEKSEDKDEGQEKSASILSAAEAGAALAREIMTKVASVNLETTQDESQMNKQAQTAGQALATALLANLQKKANAGDVTVMDGGPAPGTVPSKVHTDVMATVAEGDAAIKPMLTGDGVRNQGTINEIFDAMVADALAQGAAAEEQVHDTGIAKDEGNAESGVPNQVKTASENEDEIEKAAAITELVSRGIDFEDAVTLVKQAAVEIEFEMEKAAAMTQLMAEGVDFDEAIELVKQASAGDVTVMDGGAAPGTVPNKIQVDATSTVAEGEAAIKPLPTGDGVRNGGTVNQIFDAIVADAMAQGAAAEDQVHDTGIAKAEGNAESGVPSQVKVAAIEKMVAAGVDFDEAVEFVKEASMASMAAKVGRGAGLAAGFAGAAGKAVGGAAKAGAKKTVDAVAGMSRNQKAVLGGAAAAGVVAGGVALNRNREKKAAFDALVEAGVDFDQAAVLVAQKAQELYGE